MDQPYVMNLDQVKQYLGISDGSYDTDITTFLPSVSSAILQYLNKSWLLEVNCEFTDASAVVTVDANLVDYLVVGAVIKSNGSFTPDGVGAYTIISIDRASNQVTLSGNAAGTGSYSCYFRVLELGAKPTMAQWVLYRIQTGTVKGATKALSGGEKSKKYGPVSVTFGDGAEIGKSGYPKSLERGLWDYKRVRFG